MNIVVTITSVATNSDEIVLNFYNTVGEVTGIIIGVVLIIVGLSVIILAIVFTLKFRNDKHQRVKQSLKSQIR